MRIDFNKIGTSFKNAYNASRAFISDKIAPQVL